MNHDDQFEERLRRQPLRKVPAEWRTEILAATAVPVGSRHSVRDPRPSLLATLNHHLATLLWPHPKAWASLAALWLVILGVNLAMRDPTPVNFAGHTAPATPLMRALLKEQHQLFAELIGPIELPKADRPRPAATPHSRRREEILNA